MVSNVNFEDYSVQCKKTIEDRICSFLEDATAEIESQAKRNSRVKSGKTKGSFQHFVDRQSLTGYVGSDYENAVWEEFGTGLYALNGDGRKDVPWKYKDPSGQWHITSGKKPTRALWNAFQTLQAQIIKMAEKKLGGD